MSLLFNKLFNILIIFLNISSYLLTFISLLSLFELTKYSLYNQNELKSKKFL